MNLFGPKLDYTGEVWERNVKLVKHLETTQMTAAEKVLGRSEKKSNIQYEEHNWDCTYLNI